MSDGDIRFLQLCENNDVTPVFGDIGLSATLIFQDKKTRAVNPQAVKAFTRICKQYDIPYEMIGTTRGKSIIYKNINVRMYSQGCINYYDSLNTTELSILKILEITMSKDELLDSEGIKRMINWCTKYNVISCMKRINLKDAEPISDILRKLKNMQSRKGHWTTNTHFIMKDENIKYKIDAGRGRGSLNLEFFEYTTKVSISNSKNVKFMLGVAEALGRKKELKHTLERLYLELQ